MVPKNPRVPKVPTGMVPKKSFGSKEFLWFAKNPMAPKNSYGLKPRDS